MADFVRFVWHVSTVLVFAVMPAVVQVEDSEVSSLNRDLWTWGIGLGLVATLAMTSYLGPRKTTSEGNWFAVLWCNLFSVWMTVACFLTPPKSNPCLAALQLGYAVNMFNGGIAYYFNVYKPGGVEPSDLAPMLKKGEGRIPWKGFLQVGERNLIEYINEMSAWFMVIGITFGNLKMLAANLLQSGSAYTDFEAAVDNPLLLWGMAASALPCIVIFGHMIVRKNRSNIGSMINGPVLVANLFLAFKSGHPEHAYGVIAALLGAAAIKRRYIRPQTRTSVGYFMALNVIVIAQGMVADSVRSMTS